MKIMGGELEPDEGSVVRVQGLRTACLAQEVPQALAGSVFDLVSSGLGSMVDLLSEYRTVSNCIASSEDYNMVSELERISIILNLKGAGIFNRGSRRSLPG